MAYKIQFQYIKLTNLILEKDIHFEIIVEYMVIFSCLRSNERVKYDL